MAKAKLGKLHKQDGFKLFLLGVVLIGVLLMAIVVSTSTTSSNPQAALTKAEKQARALAEERRELAKLKAKQAAIKAKKAAGKNNTGVGQQLLWPSPKPLTGDKLCKSKYGEKSLGCMKACPITGNQGLVLYLDQTVCREAKSYFYGAFEFVAQHCCYRQNE